MKAIFIVLMVMSFLGGMIWGLITSVNHLFGTEIQHTLMNYLSILFLMAIVRATVANSINTNRKG